MNTKDIKDIALKYLAYRDHTISEMITHLKEKEFNQIEIDKIIFELCELKYLDDYNYCRKYIPYSASKGKGKPRIKTELIQKGVAPDIIDIAMEDEGEAGEALSVSELNRALQQGEKTIAGQEITEKLIAKVGRRLSTLGYTSDVVFKAIGILMKKNRGINDD